MLLVEISEVLPVKISIFFFSSMSAFTGKKIMSIRPKVHFFLNFFLPPVTQGFAPRFFISKTIEILLGGEYKVSTDWAKLENAIELGNHALTERCSNPPEEEKETYDLQTAIGASNGVTDIKIKGCSRSMRGKGMHRMDANPCACKS